MRGVDQSADRIGGRVKEVQFGGVTVELGANWVHYGEMEEDDLHPLERLVNRTNLRFVSDDYEDVIFRYRGQTKELPSFPKYVQQSLLRRRGGGD